MTCCLTRCEREATTAVTFECSGATHAYCGWHSVDSRTGALRWKDSAVRSTERIRT